MTILHTRHLSILDDQCKQTDSAGIQHSGTLLGSYILDGDRHLVIVLLSLTDNVAMFVEDIGNTMYAGPEKPHVRLHMHLDDPLEKAEKLVKAGAKTLIKCEKQFWGSMCVFFF